MLTLRKLEDKDILMFSSWLDKPHIKKWFTNKESWLNEIYHRFDTFSFVHHFIVEISDCSIGFCQYYDYKAGKETWHGDTNTDFTVSIDYFIADEEFIGKHYGTEIVKKLEETIISETNAKRIIVKPEEENKISRKTLLSAGFEYVSFNNEYGFYCKPIER